MRIWQGTALLMVAWLLLAIPVSAQNICTDKVTLGLKNATLLDAIKAIEQKTAFRFFYRDDDIKTVVRLSLPEASRTIEQTLTLLLQNTPLSFRQMDNNILLEHRMAGALCDIRGRVITPVDGKPLADASVFLSNATIGCKTGPDGAFVLQNVKSGKYELIVSNVGFTTYDAPLSVENKGIDLPAITLQPQTVLLDEVKVNSKAEPDRDRNYQLFKNEFLGTSRLASDCSILNPELLDFNYNYSANIFTASSEDYLDIENDGLGYKIKYELTNFIKDLAGGVNDVQYGGPALFREMMGTPSQQKRWQKRRLEAYEGSLMHFLRSLLNNSYEQEGFRVLEIQHEPNPARPADSIIDQKIKLYTALAKKKHQYKDSLVAWRLKRMLPVTIKTLLPQPLKQEEIVSLTTQKGLFALNGKSRSLYIVYSKIRHFPSKERIDDLDEAGNSNRTIINFDAPYVLFDKNGCLMDPNCVSFEGAWGKSRVADLLPVDYDPNPVTSEDYTTPGLNTDKVLGVPDGLDLKDGMLRLKALADSVSVAASPEKIYLQTDKPAYIQNDTLWFKAYLLNAASLAGSERSRIMYVDIANDSGRIVKNIRLPAAGGITWGNISLDDQTFSPGAYTLRAYTNWMRNFGDNYFFLKTFNISGARAGDWLVTRLPSPDSAAGKLSLRFTGLDKMPLVNTKIRIGAIRGNKHLLKQTARSDANGVIHLDIPDAGGNVLTIIAGDDNDERKVIIPVEPGRYQNADVQFLPEGGALVSGLPARIGFKAIGTDGKGIDVSGEVFDDNQNQLAVFHSEHAGIGNFSMFVESEGAYTAKVIFPDGSARNFQLPPVKNSGTVLLVRNLPQSDSLAVSVGASYDVARTGKSFYLIAQARGEVCYAAIIDFRNSNFIRGMLPKKMFPTGVVHFTLMTTDYHPVNERLVFINQNDQLNVKLSAARPQYYPGDSVSMKIKATSRDGKPVRGYFSLAVTDEQQVKTDSLDEENILFRSLLIPDVKGHIETPGYYFLPGKPSAAALDNLLLTQGWVGYEWSNVFRHAPFEYAPEKEFTVSGRAETALNKPLKGTRVTLFAKSPLILMDSITDNDGRFVFTRLPRVDTPIFLIKAVNKNGKSFNVGITINEMESPVASVLINPGAWNVNPDSTLVHNISDEKLLRDSYYNKVSGTMLKEVKVTGQKIIKDSYNLNGPGNADVVLDDKDLEAAGKKTFLQLLEERVKGFHESYIFKTSILWYFINEKPVVILVDGIKLSAIYSHLNFLDLKDWLETHTAEDIKGIEVMYKARYAWTYGTLYNPKHVDDQAYIEITTRGGHGPVIDNTPGMLLYKPLALSWPRSFYKPKYPVNDTAARRADVRSTIDWEPAIVTNDEGEATIWFYAAGRPSTYFLKLEGTDLNGNFAFETERLLIKPLPVVAKTDQGK